jgi:hypothetical protein
VNPIGYCTGCGAFRGAEMQQPQYPPPQQQYQQPQPYQQPYQRPYQPLPPRRSNTGLVVGIVVGVLVLLIGGGAAVALVVANSDDEPTDRPVTASPTTSASRKQDACVIGTWSETSSIYSMDVDGVVVNMQASGAIQRFNADGTGELDMTAGITAKNMGGSRKIERKTNGRITFKYHPQDGKIYYTDMVGSGTSTVTVDGVARAPVPVSGSTDPDEYQCIDNIFIQKGPTYRIQLQRQ